MANFSVYAPTEAGTQGDEWGRGTSFACPMVAGVLSRAMHGVRMRLGTADGLQGGFPLTGRVAGEEVTVTVAAFRDALNASAYDFAATDWDPTQSVTNQSSPLSQGATLPILVAPVPMGWGYVDGSIADPIVDEATGIPSPESPEKARASAVQATFQAAREAYWRAALP